MIFGIFTVNSLFIITPLFDSEGPYISMMIGFFYNTFLFSEFASKNWLVYQYSLMAYLAQSLYTYGWLITLQSINIEEI